MSLQLINRSPDLKRLRDEGYEIAIRGGYLLAHHVPYVNGKKQINFGTLVTSLTYRGNQTVKPDNHVIHFIGEHPCNKDGTIITAIQHASTRQQFHEGVIIDHSFSNKPASGYADYYEKVSRYADIISAPAKSISKEVTEKTFKVASDIAEESVFQYPDTNSTRANINMINTKFSGQKIAIIGLGGTGAYILDLVVKTPVAEIHLFDGDLFHQHNAFRSPGAASGDQLDKMSKKVAYYAGVYGKMHKHMVLHDYYIDGDNISKLDGMTYVFICVDKNSVRRTLMAYLLKLKTPFIDVGMGVQAVDDFLIGTVRVTSATSLKNDHLANRVALEDSEDNVYASNIQIADLNMLNASLAVITWKKMTGFYQDLIQEHNATYTINAAQLNTTDFTA